MNTVLITGCSTGFGHEIARHFLDNGWNVVATMRTPARNTLPESDRLRVLPLDVTDPVSIAEAIANAGPIDVLINNAGIGWINALEGTPLDVARQLFETNLFGAMSVMQAVLPQFRERGAGVIVNISSSVTLKAYPLLSVYTASKAALNALTHTAALELAPFGIRTHIVNPGLAPDTSFAASVMENVTGNGGFPPAYLAQAEAVMQALQNSPPDEVTSAQDVAKAAWRAATDPSSPASMPAGADAIAAAEGR